MLSYDWGFGFFVLFFNKSITTASSNTTREDKEIKVMSQPVNHSQNSVPKEYVHKEAMQQNSAHQLNLPVKTSLRIKFQPLKN